MDDGDGASWGGCSGKDFLVLEVEGKKEQRLVSVQFFF